MLSVSRRQIALALVGVCILSAGVATGATLLLARTGSQGIRGPAGPQGLRGPRGFEGPEGYIDTDGLGIGPLETEVAGLRGAVEELESQGNDTSYLESQIAEVESQVSDLCRELDAFC